MRMHHVAISVHNMERSIAFYRDMFGMEAVTPIFPFGGPDNAAVQGLDDPQGRMCVIQKDTTRLELFEYAQPAPQSKDPNYPVSDHGYSHFGFEVDGIEAIYDRLAAAGVRFHAPVTTFPSGMKATYGRDPDGNVFELLEMGPPPAAK